MGRRSWREHAAFHVPGRAGAESAGPEAEGVAAGSLLHAVDEAVRAGATEAERVRIDQVRSFAAEDDGPNSSNPSKAASHLASCWRSTSHDVNQRQLEWSCMPKAPRGLRRNQPRELASSAPHPSAASISSTDGDLP